MLSPLLFIIFLNSLLVKIKRELPREIIEFGYADDLCFYIKNEYALYKVINILEKWCLEYKMLLNKKKCGVIKIAKKNTKNAFIDITGQK